MTSAATPPVACDRARQGYAAWLSLNERTTRGAHTLGELAAAHPTDIRLRDKATTMQHLAEHVTAHPFGPDGAERADLYRILQEGLSGTSGGAREAYVTLAEYTRTT